MEIELGDSKHIGRWTMPQKGMLTTRFTAEMQQSVLSSLPKRGQLSSVLHPKTVFLHPMKIMQTDGQTHGLYRYVVTGRCYADYVCKYRMYVFCFLRFIPFIILETKATVGRGGTPIFTTTTGFEPLARVTPSYTLLAKLLLKNDSRLALRRQPLLRCGFSSYRKIKPA